MTGGDGEDVDRLPNATIVRERFRTRVGLDASPRSCRGGSAAKQTCDARPRVRERPSGGCRRPAVAPLTTPLAAIVEHVRTFHPGPTPEGETNDASAPPGDKYVRSGGAAAVAAVGGLAGCARPPEHLLEVDDIPSDGEDVRGPPRSEREGVSARGGRELEVSQVAHHHRPDARRAVPPGEDELRAPGGFPRPKVVAVPRDEERLEAVLRAHAAARGAGPRA